MSQSRSTQPAPASDSALAMAIAQLAREASIELNVQDVDYLDASQGPLAPGKKIYVSFLPKRSWQQTVVASMSAGSLAKLLGDHGPESLVRSLALARLRGELEFHLFCFGGFLRSCEWLHAVSAGRVRLTDDGDSPALAR
jgi:hypothetical protein